VAATIAEILRATLATLTEGRWGKGHLWWPHSAAEPCCLAGHIYAATGRVEWLAKDAIAAVHRALDLPAIVAISSWQDRPDRTLADVRASVQRAIDTEEARDAIDDQRRCPGRGT
jgi:hypothetical protein